MRSAWHTGIVDAAPAGARGLPVGGSALLVAMACGSDVDERGRGGGNRDAGEIERCRHNEAHLVGVLSEALSLFCAVLSFATPAIQVQPSFMPSFMSRRTSTRMFCSFCSIFSPRRSFWRSPLCEGMRARRANLRTRIEGRWTTQIRSRPLSLLVSLHGHVRKTPVAAQINRRLSRGRRRHARPWFSIF